MTDRSLDESITEYADRHWVPLSEELRGWARRAKELREQIARLEQELADQEGCQLILWDDRESPAWAYLPDMLHLSGARRSMPDGILYRLVPVEEAPND